MVSEEEESEEEEEGEAWAAERGGAIEAVRQQIETQVRRRSENVGVVVDWNGGVFD